MGLKELTLPEIQTRLTAMVRDFDVYARQQGLTYWMSGGTLLGAVRHRGFIPWDDDIDLVLPRRDYDRLCRDYADGRYRLSCVENDPAYGTPYARIWNPAVPLVWGNHTELVRGLYIDLFPMDGYPPGMLRSRLREMHLKLLRRERMLQQRQKLFPNERWKALKNFYRKHPRRRPHEISLYINRLGRRHDYDTGRYIGVQSGSYHAERERMPREIYDSTVYLPFSGLSLPAPGGWDEYLRRLYGDYMTLPPEEKRVPRHEARIYAPETQ